MSGTAGGEGGGEGGDEMISLHVYVHLEARPLSEGETTDIRRKM